jgi:hypothetical protein
MSNKEVAIKAYDVYCKAVGGVAFNGTPLPTGEEFFADVTKEKQANGWIAVAEMFSTPEVTTYKERLTKEYDDLMTKTDALSAGLIAEGFLEKVGQAQFDLLKEQLFVMVQYREILDKRIKLIAAQ